MDADHESHGGEDPLDRISAEAMRISMALAAVIGLIATVLGHWQIAYSVLLSAAIFMWSLRQQMRAFQNALARRIASTTEHDQSASGHYGPAFMRVLLLLLALGGILWYTPAQPIGVVLGVGCVLIGLAVSALKPGNR
jgi:hypothetical protein